MKPQKQQPSTSRRISKSPHRAPYAEVFEYFESITHDWTEAEDLMHDYMMAEYSEEIETGLKRPNPPTPEAIKRAQFVDKTYHWNNADLRSGDKRTSK